MLILLAQIRNISAQSAEPCFSNKEGSRWADSVCSKMDYYAKIGQLFMVDAFSNKDSLHVAGVNALIDSFQIGGLIFFQGGPLRQARLTNAFQKRSKFPLLIGIDGEWGLSMRLDSSMRFPRQMTLAAGSDIQRVTAMGREIGRQCKRMGIHINFAPDVDVNNNPENPIINSRSFGEDKSKVADFGTAYMQGMQESKVLACAKHFPGHGDTNTDSHHALPLVSASRERLDTLELYPFRKLIEKGVASVMVAHLAVPALDSTPELAASLSPRVVNGLLKDTLGFRGLVFTDALNMKGVSDYYPSGELELKALLAGNDILLYSGNIAKSVERIHLALQNCEIDQDFIDEKVKKILKAKYWVGLNHYVPVNENELINELNTPDARWLNYTLYKNAPTLLKNDGSLIPLNPYYRDCIASLVVNDSVNNAFQKQLACYANVDAFQLNKDASDEVLDQLANMLDEYDRVIVSVHNTSINAAKNFGLTPPMLQIIDRISRKKGSVLCVFGNPYVLGRIEQAHRFPAVIEAYEDTWLPQIQVAQKIFGALDFSGKLPVSVPPDFNIGRGLPMQEENKLKFTLPEDAGIKSADLNRIDSLVLAAISDSIFPGCQVLVGLKGKVIYNKAFGAHTYDNTRPTRVDDVYDIASVTKIAATALALMHLYDKRKIDPDAKVSRYLRILKHTDKDKMTIRQLMAHEAGLKAWIPFWQETVDSTGLMNRFYRNEAQRDFTVKVADSLFLSDDFQEQIWHTIIESPLATPGKYVYSDLGLIILQKLVEKVSGKPLNEYVDDLFYKPIGLHEMGYQPLNWISKERIVPTEIDTAYRHRLVHGFVHDPAAAMMDGVGGHAGVFCSAQSLAVIMQLLLNKGEYGNKRFIKKETVEKFTSKAFPESSNRRALIFDKPDASLGENGPSAISASSFAFGHSGFTGTCAWADPQNGLIYIFLSNRVYPSASNNKLSKSNLRTRIMQVVYDAGKP